LKVAVLGLGNAGFDLHVPALLGIAGVETIAVDTDAARRQRAQDRYKVAVVDSLDAAMAQHRPDVVVVATPPDSHVALCRQIMEAGADVFCEKPFAPSVADAEAIIEIARLTGRRVALNHEFREMPIFRALRDQIGRPDVGNLVFAQAWQNMDLPPWKEPGWRGQLLTGTLYEAGLHLVDYCIALFGEKPVSVTATASTCGVRPEASDAVALVTMEFSRGRLAQVIQNRLCPGETQYFEVRADAEKASLRASFGGRARISAGMYRATKPHLRLELGASGMAWREVGHQRTTIASNPKAPAMAATRIMIEKTLAAFRGNTRPPATAEDGRDAIEVLAAAYLSAESGRRIAVDGSAELRSFRFGPAASGS
jgi:scyllo-inositol 2-dehydrogenase (NADP+)